MPSRPVEEFLIVNQDGVPVKDPRTNGPIIYHAKGASQAAKKAFYSNMRRLPEHRIFECKEVDLANRAPPKSREQVLEAISHVVKDEGLRERWVDRFFEAQERAHTLQCRVHVVKQGKPRISSFDVFRKTRWPFSNHSIQKQIFIETKSRYVDPRSAVPAPAVPAPADQ